MKASSFFSYRVLFLIYGWAAVPLQAEYREWSDKKGRKLEAEFIRLDGNSVILSTRDGAKHRYELLILSDVDQRLASTLKPKEAVSVAGRDVMAAAAQIDRLVELDLARHQLKRNTPANPERFDEVFVRRIYLDITGTIPNYEQTVTFVRDRDPDKRSKLINSLLDSEGYVSHMYNYFSDMLRLTQNLGGQVEASPYLNWVKEQVRSDQPYNLMVKDMLTASGKLWDNPATGYLLRDSGMPLDNVAVTTSIFLGTDVACAQCHDHPFAAWTQKNFYELASFFGATTTRVNTEVTQIRKEATDLLQKAGYRQRTRKEEEQNVRIDKDLRNVMGRIDNLLTANRFAVEDRNENQTKLPQDYQYKNGTPGGFVAPKFLVWSDAGDDLPIYQLSLEKPEKLREAFAQWMTDPENPRFALTIANRMWKHAMGVGIAEPVDAITLPEESANPELLLHLGNEMRRLDFSLKEFLRIVYHTKTYQSESAKEEPRMGEPYHFPGPVLRRMSAEQVWDSFMTLVIGNPDKFKGDSGAHLSRALDLNLELTTAQVVLQKLAAQGRMGTMGDMEETKSLKNAMDSDKIININGLRLMRASELEQPARDSHFLRQFGQSDRQVNDNGSLAGSVPQVLMMMNGPAQEVLSNKESLIFKTMAKERSASDKINVVFYSILNRRPTFLEMDIVRREIATHPNMAVSNIIWALINTREFLFIQ